MTIYEITSRHDILCPSDLELAGGGSSKEDDRQHKQGQDPSVK